MNAILAINAIAEIADIGSRCPKVYKRRKDPFQLLDNEFQRKYRFSKESVLYIVSLVKEDLQRNRRGMGITPELQVLTALRCWGGRKYQDDSADLHGMAQSTVSRVCSRVAHAIARLAPRFIKMPSGIREEQATVRQFQNIANMPTIIGAIDCTHIKIKKTAGNRDQYYINEKGVSSLNVQAVCDSELRILDLDARWMGNTNDSTIFSESNLKTRFEQGEFSGRLLGDSGYPLLPYLLTPILQPQNIQDERYNSAHIKTRHPIERCFGVLKQRFPCLLFGLTVSLENAKVVIVALCVLHNIAIDRNDEIIDEEVIANEQPHGVDTHDVALQHINNEQGRFVLDIFIQTYF